MMNFYFNASELLFALLELFLLSAIAIILLFDLFISDRLKHITYYLSQLALLLTGLLAFNLIGESAIIFSGTFVLDTLGSTFKVFILAFAIIALAYTRHYLKVHDLLRNEYFILALMSILGMLIMVSGHSLLTLYLGLEIMSLSLYALIATARDRTAAIEAALKYFVLGAIASGLLLYGMSMIYGISGSLNIAQISNFASAATLGSQQTLILNFGLVFLVIGVAFKLGAVPFHMWVPDVYQGSPTSVTMFLSSVPKIAAVAILIRLLIDVLGSLQYYWSDLFMILAILSIAIGSLVALNQTNIKRMLAYSTISHIGFVLLGFVTGVVDGYGAAVFYVLTYILMSLAAFGVIIALNKNGFEADQIADFQGLSKSSPWLALIMLVVMLSMAGVPPFIGFYSKLFILQQVVAEGYVILAVLAVIFAVISAYYYLQIIKTMYFSDKDKSIVIYAPLDMKVLLSINGILILLVGLMPSFWMELSVSLF